VVFSLRNDAHDHFNVHIFYGYAWTEGDGLSTVSYVLISSSPPVSRFDEIDTPNPQLLALSLRIQHRALSLALRSPLQYFHDALFGSGAVSEKKLDIRHPYTSLHPRLASFWERRAGRLTGYATIVTYIFVGNLLFSAINPVSLVIAGLISSLTMALYRKIAAGCICAWNIAYFVFSFSWLCSILVKIAVANEQIASITQLYRDALRDFRELGVKAQNRPANPDRDALLIDMRSHEALLLSYAEVDKHRSTFLGFSVTFGTVRTLVGTVITVLIGLWGILRSAGTYVTIQSVCFV
jgi:hypothetical protein